MHIYMIVSDFILSIMLNRVFKIDVSDRHINHSILLIETYNHKIKLENVLYNC